ncbi:hypothetical protein, partial [Erythrobacter donghaensis]|uniref:hypothetical protein n=1 Tax=Erythrobacter donghaensis TaxID=267135 RepID=UPI000AC5625F
TTGAADLGAGATGAGAGFGAAATVAGAGLGAGAGVDAEGVPIAAKSTPALAAALLGLEGRVGITGPVAREGGRSVVWIADPVAGRAIAGAGLAAAA